MEFPAVLGVFPSCRDLSELSAEFVQIFLELCTQFPHSPDAIERMFASFCKISADFPPKLSVNFSQTQRIF